MKPTEMLSEATIDKWLTEFTSGDTDAWAYYHPIGGYEFKRKDSDIDLFYDHIYRTITVSDSRDSIKYAKFPFRLRRKLHRVQSYLLKSMSKRLDADRMIRINNVLEIFGLSRQPSLSKARSLLKSTIISMLDDMLKNMDTEQTKWIYVTDQSFKSLLRLKNSYLILQNWPGGDLTASRTEYRDAEVLYSLKLSYPQDNLVELIAPEKWQRATINAKMDKIFKQLDFEKVITMHSMWEAWDYLRTKEKNDNYGFYVESPVLKQVELEMAYREANGPDENGQMKLNFEAEEN